MTTIAPADFIDGRRIAIPGDAILTRNPARPSEIVWSGSPNPAHVDLAVTAARKALPAWAALSREQRGAYLKKWKQATAANAERLARLLTRENGKTLAEARLEASALGGKVDITLDPEGALRRVTPESLTLSDTRTGRCLFRPHGVMAVIGPFNFPAHLPNGHWVPALLLGNTIVFKPSEKTAAVGQLLAELWEEVGLPPGVFNLVHGAAPVASALVNHDGLDGILFTGSWPVGRRILEANLDRPGRMIALEMGGNNPAVIMADCNLRQAVMECVRAAFATTGQRCTCTRRIIVADSIADRFIDAFAKTAANIRVGPGDAEPAPFCGPLISEAAVSAVLEFQQALLQRGGRIVLEARRPTELGEGHFITPGAVRVPRFEMEHDCEIFGPLVQISTAGDLDDALAQANATQFGLAASIFTADRSAAERFLVEAKAGCVNVNTGTAGASSKLPFGGLGRSGNHRPAGAFSVDYCAYPVAAMLERGDAGMEIAGVEYGG